MQLPKTIFNGGPMVVFIAGLEGTGHHAMCRALHPRCPSNSAELARPCFYIDPNLTNIVRPLLYPKQYVYRDATQGLVSRLRWYKSNLPHTARVLFQCSDTANATGGFMASYPDQALADTLTPPHDRVINDRSYLGKSTARPDARMLALHAEANQIDLRIVHLRREPILCVFSRVKVAGRATIDAVISVALDNAIALKAQLSALDLAFTFELNHTSGRQQAADLAAFLKVPAFANHFREVWHSNDEQRLEDLSRRKSPLIAYVRSLWALQVDFTATPSTYSQLYGVAGSLT